MIYRGGSVQDGAPEALAPVGEALGGADGHEPHRRMAGDGQHHDVEALHIIRASDALRAGSRPANMSSALQPSWQRSGAWQEKGSIKLCKHQSLPHCVPEGLFCREPNCFEPFLSMTLDQVLIGNAQHILKEIAPPEESLHSLARLHAQPACPLAPSTLESKDVRWSCTGTMMQNV